MGYANDADLLARVPDASSIDPATRQLALDDAQPLISDSLFHPLTVQAHVLLAAHFLALRTGELGGESGPATSMRAGEIATSHAVFGAVDRYDMTRWGREFMTLSQSRLYQPIVG